MRYQPNMQSIRRHAAPAWYEDAKLGIFIHWGIYSVPAFAPPTWALGDVPADENWFTNNPYAEWYLNSLRIGRGPTYEYHLQKYGADFTYEDFVDLWKAERFDPAGWADLFRRSGARYVVPVTKHHDGFCLWDSRYTAYNAARRGPGRDLMDELCRAVRAGGMRFGVYYSGIIDWRFSADPMLSNEEVSHPYNVTGAYADYAYNQVMELIDRYKPSVLWNDIGWPEKGLCDLPYLFAHYYNTVPEGVVNDRWSGVFCDFTTREYNAGEKNVHAKWECCRGLGLSFGYNQAEDERHLIAPNDLIALLIDTVAHNGNLLINVGPRADGVIPEAQRARLEYLGAWLQNNGEAIYGTRPWRQVALTAPGGEQVYYTANGQRVYALILNPRKGLSEVLVPALGDGAATARALGGINARFAAEGSNLRVRLEGVAQDAPPVALCVGP